MDRVAREHVLANIRENLRNLAQQVPERLQTFEQESGQKLTFANFIRFDDYDPTALLAKDSWTGWRARARLVPEPADPDQRRLQPGLLRAVQVNGPRELTTLRTVASRLREENVDGAMEAAGPSRLSVHYRLWGKPGSDLGFTTLQDSFEGLRRNPAFLSDLVEILDWADSESRIGGAPVNLPFPSHLELHAQYSNNDIKAALGIATFQTAGQTGVGLLHSPERKTYAVLVTFQKTEREFSPSTMYADYPISRELLHWESPSNTTQASETGQNLINHQHRNYTILIFARSVKRLDRRTAPFTFFGSASLVSFQQERPIQMVWRLNHLIPAVMFEENRRGG